MLEQVAEGKVPAVFVSKFFLAAVLTGPLCWVLIGQFKILPISYSITSLSLQQLLMIGLIYPVIEELTFRGAIQSLLRRMSFGRRRFLVLSTANIITSIIFTLSHILIQPTLWAILVFIPSLIFGELRDRHGSTMPSIVLHCFYNTGYFGTLLFVR